VTSSCIFDVDGVTVDVEVTVSDDPRGQAELVTSGGDGMAICSAFCKSRMRAGSATCEEGKSR
jgi:hypothetical protein